MKKNWFLKNFNKKNFLIVGSKVFVCQIGELGFKKAQKKIEGDKTTPIGKWYLNEIFYRSDKIARPIFKKKNNLRINKITKNCGWCDDIRSNKYNKYIKINNFQSSNFSYENLWREDEAYDIMITCLHNVKPTIKNRGSAIFIHCSFTNKRATSGCIALEKKNLFFLIKNLRYKTFIKI